VVSVGVALYVAALTIVAGVWLLLGATVAGVGLLSVGAAASLVGLMVLVPERGRGVE
jgi:hypothetical protein